MEDVRDKHKKQTDDRESQTQKEAKRRYNHFEMERLRNQVKNATRNNNPLLSKSQREDKDYTFFSSGTHRYPYRYPVGRFIDSLYSRGVAEHEDIIAVLEHDTHTLRIVRVPRFAGRAILARATRSGDKRIFCTSASFESREERQNKVEYLEEKKAESVSHKGREVEFFLEEDL